MEKVSGRSSGESAVSAIFGVLVLSDHPTPWRKKPRLGGQPLWPFCPSVPADNLKNGKAYSEQAHVKAAFSCPGLPADGGVHSRLETVIEDRRR